MYTLKFPTIKISQKIYIRKVNYNLCEFNSETLETWDGGGGRWWKENHFFWSNFAGSVDGWGM